MVRLEPGDQGVREPFVFPNPVAGATVAAAASGSSAATLAAAAAIRPRRSPEIVAGTRARAASTARTEAPRTSRTR